MDDITQIVRYVRLRDPAVDTWKKVQDAGEDDGAYEAAIVELRTPRRRRRAAWH